MLIQKKELVSICIPVYNGGAYLNDTLESIINQTYENIEIIISDNCSTDNTKEICLKYQMSDNRIKYFRNDNNIGYCSNINNAVSKSKGEIIAIFHADDIYDKKIIEIEMKLLTETENIQGVFSGMEFYYSEKKIKKNNILKKLLNTELFHSQKNAFIGGYQEFIPILMKYGNIFACPSFLTKKSIFTSIGGFTDVYKTNEDLELWIKYLKSGYKLAIANNELLKYRVSQINASAKVRTSSEIGVVYSVIEDMIIYKNINITHTDLVNFKKYKAFGYIFAAYNAYVEKNISKMNANIKLSMASYNYSILSHLGICQKLPNFCFNIKKKVNNFID